MKEQRPERFRINVAAAVDAGQQPLNGILAIVNGPERDVPVRCAANAVHLAHVVAHPAERAEQEHAFWMLTRQRLRRAREALTLQALRKGAL
jgi:hypothetical protein